MTANHKSSQVLFSFRRFLLLPQCQQCPVPTLCIALSLLHKPVWCWQKKTAKLYLVTHYLGNLFASCCPKWDSGPYQLASGDVDLSDWPCLFFLPVHSSWIWSIVSQKSIAVLHFWQKPKNISGKYYCCLRSCFGLIHTEYWVLPATLDS